MPDLQDLRKQVYHSNTCACITQSKFTTLNPPQGSPTAFPQHNPHSALPHLISGNPSERLHPTKTLPYAFPTLPSVPPPTLAQPSSDTPRRHQSPLTHDQYHHPKTKQDYRQYFITSDIMCDWEEFHFTCGHNTSRLLSHCHFSRTDPVHQCFGVRVVRHVWQHAFACRPCLVAIAAAEEAERKKKAAEN